MSVAARDTWHKLDGRWVEKKPPEEMWESKKGKIFHLVKVKFKFVSCRFEDKRNTEEIRRAQRVGGNEGEMEGESSG